VDIFTVFLDGLNTGGFGGIHDLNNLY